MRTEHFFSEAAQVITLRKALSGKRAAQLLHLPIADLCAVQRLTVNVGHRRYIFRTLHASFDLNAGNTHFVQLFQILHKTVILQTQRIFFVITVIAVGHAAGLRALTAVSAAPADHGRHIALTGIAHT